MKRVNGHAAYLTTLSGQWTLRNEALFQFIPIFKTKSLTSELSETLPSTTSLAFQENSN